jgi:predicted nuclease of predicted toxin-antitoxin system
VKFLFDENLSPRLVQRLGNLYSGSVHVRDVGLERSDDQIVWRYAQTHGFAIITKDADFRQMSFVYGHPPKVVWIQRGNCSTSEIAQILTIRFADIEGFEADAEAAFLSLK